MANHIQTILAGWYPRRDHLQWVLGTVVETQGSSYRKAGAMMMINELGQYYGLLSGGCLEKALLVDVKKVLAFDRAAVVDFDSTDNTDVAWQLGLGCGGRVRICLQPVHAGNDYQRLDRLLTLLSARQSGLGYRVVLPAAESFSQTAAVPKKHSSKSLSAKDTLATHGAQIMRSNDIVHVSDTDPIPVREAQGIDQALVIPLCARRHIAVFGGGVDALPLTRLASNLGWRVTLVEHRVGYANAADFDSVDQILRHAPAHADVAAVVCVIDAAFVMTHNVTQDAEALKALKHSSARYIGLLGPAHRKGRVLLKAGLADDPRIHGPMGLDLGGELPESVALSAVAQCHQSLEHAQAQVTTGTDKRVAQSDVNHHGRGWA